jgi:uncharacterized MnhB-related membrane protein
MRYVLKSITNNVKSLIATGILGVIVVYIFTTVTFTHFSYSFPDLPGQGNTTIPMCQNMITCTFNSMNFGLRASGGLGRLMQFEAFNSDQYSLQIIYQLLFYAAINVVFLQIILGLMIRTFQELRNLAYRRGISQPFTPKLIV